MVNLFSLELNNSDIIYDDKVKKTYGGQGVVRLNDRFLGQRVYVVFPMEREDTENGILVTVDEILNKGIRPNNGHSSKIILGKEYVGRRCLLVLQEIWFCFEQLEFIMHKNGVIWCKLEIMQWKQPAWKMKIV